MLLYIAVLSYAFQIAGALLLLLWCIGKCNANVVKDCFRNHPAPLWLEMDEKGAYTTVSKEDLQESAKTYISTSPHLRIWPLDMHWRYL